MFLRRLLISCLFLVGCGSGDRPNLNTNANANAGPVQTRNSATFQILGLPTVKADTAIARFQLQSSSGGQVEAPRDPSQNSLSLSLQNLPAGEQQFTLLALDSLGRVVSHYQVSFVVPGQVLVHIDRLTPGPPVPSGALHQWIELTSLPVAGNPGLTETRWKSAVDVPSPFQRSQYDVIGLHRLVSKRRRPGRALLFLPGAQCNGNLYTSDETRDFRLYLANRGYDVYSLDYRIHFAPPFNLMGVDIPGLVAPDLRFMAAWDSRTFISDVNDAVQKVKAESGVTKLFLSGFSSGGQFTYFYACSQQAGGLGQDNLAGLIVIDGGPWQEAAPQPPNTLSMTLARNTLMAGDTAQNRTILQGFGLDPGPGYYSQGFGHLLDANFLASVVAYLLDPTDSLAANYIIDRFQNNWGVNSVGDGQFTNIQRGYNDLPGLLAWSVLAADTYWPMIQGLEDTVLTNYAGPVPGPYHIPTSAATGLGYLDRLNQITIPQLAFGTTGLDGFLGTQMAWKFQGLNLSASTDKEQRLLEHFGHLDALSGTHANTDLAVPLLDWLDRH